MLIHSIHVGIAERGTMIPASSNCGTITTGMNCTAWNSVRAKALASKPNPTPSTALMTAIRITHAGLPWVLNPSSRKATAQASAAWAAAASENAVP